MINKKANCCNIETNFKYRTVCHKYVQYFSEHFQLIFNNSNVNNDKKSKTKNGKLFFCKLFRIIKFFFLILLRKATLESKVSSTNRNSAAFLLHTSKTNVSWLQTFLELIFPTKIKTMLLKQSTVLFTRYQKNIAYIMCLNT